MSPEDLVQAVEAKFPNVKKEEPAEDAFRDEVPILMVPADDLHGVCQTLRDGDKYSFDFLKNLTAIDYEDRMTLVMHFYSLKYRHKLALKVDLDRDDPIVDSVSDVWLTANWQEREVFDLFGIQFNNHPDLRRIMLPDDWVGHPLRKDYVHEPDQYD